MSIRNTLLGGTDWPDGAVVTAADLNDTFDEVITVALMVDTQTDASEYTVTSSSTPTLKKTFTFTPTDVNTVITHIRLKAELKNTLSSPTQIGISVSGSNLGEFFYIGSSQHGLGFWDENSSAPQSVASNNVNTLKEVIFDLPCHFEGDTSYSIKIWLWISDANGISSLDEQELKVFFKDNIGEQ